MTRAATNSGSFNGILLKNWPSLQIIGSEKFIQKCQKWKSLQSDIYFVLYEFIKNSCANLEIFDPFLL